MFKERFKLVSAVHLILVKDNRILLLRRFNTGYEDGNYSVIAGHLDGGESAKHAMAREALEEGGIIINPNDLKFAVAMHRYSVIDNSGSKERIDFFFVTDKWKGELTIGEPDKCDDLSWFDMAALPQNMVPYVRAGLEAFHKGEHYVEFGWE